LVGRPRPPHFGAKDAPHGGDADIGPAQKLGVPIDHPTLPGRGDCVFEQQQIGMVEIVLQMTLAGES